MQSKAFKIIALIGIALPAATTAGRAAPLAEMVTLCFKSIHAEQPELLEFGLSELGPQTFQRSWQMTEAQRLDLTPTLRVSFKEHEPACVLREIGMSPDEAKHEFGVIADENGWQTGGWPIQENPYETGAVLVTDTGSYFVQILDARGLFVSFFIYKSGAN